MDIGWHEFAIKNIIDDYNKKLPTNAIDKMIDDATGYGKIRDAETIDLLLGHFTRLLRKVRIYNRLVESKRPTKPITTIIRELKTIKLQDNGTKENRAMP
jgi:hypothetical protein